MIELLRKYRFHIVAALLLFAALIFYSLNLRHRNSANGFERVVLSVTAPVLAVLEKGTGAGQSVWDDYIFLVNLRQENRRLLDLVKVQNGRLIEANEALLENERLKGLLDMKKGLRYPSLAATIIGGDSSPWFRTLLIDRGAADGIREGMPVLAVNGVVGQVVRTTANSSRVLLITDNSSALAALIERSRARGVVRGKGEGLCTLEFALREDDVKIGDQVVTSGIGGIFPKGLAVGEVTMVKKGEYGIFQSVDIRPSVNLSRLEDVIVLLHLPDE